MQDEEKLKEKVQLLLDNRQIFLIFLASAVLLALTFSMGVVVGQRMSTRPDTQQPTDTLALLDQFEQEETKPVSFTFHEALTGGDQAGGAATAGKAGEGKDSTGAGKAASASDEDGDKKAGTGKEKTSTDKHPGDEASAEGGGQTKPDKKATSSDDKHAASGTKKAVVGDKKPAAGDTANNAGNEAAAKESGDDGEDGKAGFYTLQLSAFQDPAEAKQFMESLKDTGMKPYLVKAQIPGRGMWYRVRIGSFDSWDAALEAKTKFERERNIIAYVARQ